MHTMTWEEIEKDWSGLQKRHRMELAQAVARYCVGHKMEEVADRLGYTRQWVITQLDYAGMGVGLGSSNLTLTGSTDNVAKEVPRVIKEFGPDVECQIVGQGGTDCKVEGKDAEAFEPYVDRYLQQGHEPAAATRLARAEWAAEAAVEAGVIKETTNKRNEKVNQILFPQDAKETFELDLRMHMARVEAAARFLDLAKINHLRRKATCERVAAAHEKWLEQVERVLNLHPTLNKDV